jgi:hypothetical protein
MSKSSTGLVEVAIASDSSSTVSGVASFLSQLEEQFDRLEPNDTKRLCAIEVIRRGRGGVGSRTRKTRISSLGRRTWVLGTCDLARDPPPDEQKLIDRATRLLREKWEENLEPDWIQLGHKSRIAKEVQEGDLLIQVWRPHGVKQPKSVISNCAVLLKQKTKRWTRIFLGKPTKQREVSWAKFQRLLQTLGYTRRLGNWPVVVLDEDLSGSIQRKWNVASK